MKTDWIMVDLIIPKEYYIKTTEKSVCFRMWGKRFLPFPLKFMQKYQEIGASISLQMPAWFIAKNSLRSLVFDEDLKAQLFPLKRDLKKAQALVDAPLLEEQDKKAEAAPAMQLKEPERTSEPIPIGQGGLF